MTTYSVLVEGDSETEFNVQDAYRGVHWDQHPREKGKMKLWFRPRTVIAELKGTLELEWTLRVVHNFAKTAGFFIHVSISH
jgi:hypothetical protein